MVIHAAKKNNHLTGTTMTCRSLVEAATARAEEVDRFALVMVHPTQELDGSMTYIMHTMMPNERPIAVRLFDLIDRMPCIYILLSACSAIESIIIYHSW